MAESTASLREEIYALSGVDIMKNANEFKSTYAIMDELSHKWEDLSDIAQATIIELIAGKHQGNVFSSLMANFDTAREALKTSANSSGSAMAEHAKWSESLEARLLKLKATWQSLSQSFLNSDFLKGGLDAITGFVNGIDTLISKFGTLPTLLTGFTLFNSLFKKDSMFNVFKTFDTDLDGFTNKIGILSKSFAELGNAFNSGRTRGGLKGFLDGLKSVKNSFKNALSETDLTAIKSYNSLIDQGIDAQDAFQQTMRGSSAAAQNLVAGANGGKVAMQGLTAATNTSKLAMMGLTVAATAMNAVLTIGLSALFTYAAKKFDEWHVSAEELAEKVDEVITKYKDQHSELMKIKGDYDTTNEDALISKYAELSKGVDTFGRNLSLTADEYAEYQNIVKTIADQIPSLVSGYDSQGNAILSCAGDVNTLTAAYEELIKKQNDEVLINSSKDINKDFKNAVKDAEQNTEGWFGGANWTKKLNLGASKLSTESAKIFENILNSTDAVSKFNKEFGKAESDMDAELLTDLDAMSDLLENAGFEKNGKWYNQESDIEHIRRALKENASKVKDILNNYYSELEVEAEGKKQQAQAALSNALDLSDSMYYGMSDTMKNIAKQTVDSFDFELFADLEKQGISVETYVNDMLDSLNSLSKTDKTSIETAFELRTKFNGGDISYGEYVNSIQEIGDLIDKSHLPNTAKDAIKNALNIDGVIEQYNALSKRLQDDFKWDKSKAENFLDSLSAEEFAVAMEIIPELDTGTTASDIQNMIDKEMAMRGLTVKLDIEVEKANIEAVTTALSEMVSGAGMSSESISTVEGMFSGLKGYDPSKLFERTANGIKLNREELGRLNSEYSKTNLAELNKEMSSLGDIYNQTREELYKLAYGTDEYNAKAAELSGIESRINELEKLKSQYKGISSAYQQWQIAESAGNERDMYENVIAGIQTVKDELSRGWADDSTVEFLELLTGRTDLASKSGKELKEVWDGLSKTIKHTAEGGHKGYSILDFFTTDKDGNATSKGVYNFLDAIGHMEEEVFGGIDKLVERDDKDNIIGFNFDLVGGDKVIAEALGVSEELVQIMVRAADDAGFVVSMDGTYQQLDVLREKAQLAAESMNEILEGDNKKTINIDMNADSLEKIQPQIDSIMDAFGKKDGSGKLTGAIDMSINGAEDALTVVSTLQSMKDRLERPAYMKIQTNQVDDALKEPLKNLQDYRTNIERLNQAKLHGADTTELEASIKESKNKVLEGLQEIQKENPKLAVELGIDGDSEEQLLDKIETGNITVPASIDIQLEIDEKLGVLVDKTLLDAGLLDPEEFEKRVDLYLNGNTDASDVQNDVENAVSDVADEAETEPTEIIQPIEINPELSKESAWSKFKNFWKENVQPLYGAPSIEPVETKADVKVTEGEVDASGLEDGVKTGVEGRLNAIGVETETDVEANVGEVKTEGFIDKVASLVKGLFSGGGSDSTEVETKADVKVNAGNIDTSSVDAAIEGVVGGNAEETKQQNVEVAATTSGKEDVESLKSIIDSIKDKKVKVSASTSGLSALNSLKTAIDAIQDKTVTVTVNTVKTGEPAVNGTANASGTAFANGTTDKSGRAFKQGDWGVKNSQIALTGELGQELVVYGNRWYTVGDTGAEFAAIPKGAIVFNHKQTEELFKNGKVTSGGGRGRALASGTAFAFPNGSSGIGGGFWDNNSSTKPSSSSSSSSSNNSSNSNSNSKLSKKEYFQFEWKDWIEVLIDRVERGIDRISRVIENAYINIERKSVVSFEKIAAITEEIALQEQAYNRYIEQANKVELTDGTKEKIHNGEISIIQYDKEPMERVNEYIEWYEKALDCKDAIDELKESLAECYEVAFDNVVAHYDGLLSIIEHEKNILEEYINQSEAQAWLVSKQYYDALAKNERENIAELENKKVAMIESFSAAMDSGTIEEGSEAYYNIVSSIDEVTLAIQESKTQLLEYDQTIEQLNWEVFDLLQDKVSSVTEETEFLINLLSNNKLYDDNGKLTNEGSATIGLHGVAYNTAIHQADLVAEEIKRLKEELEKDPFDTELEERYREMVALQQEYILSAEDSKNAIRDLVEEGIQLELDALDERIEKYKDSINSARDLYEYNKKVKEQSEEIANLEKQRLAYQNDDSEEAKAKLQEIEVSLKEAEENLAETETDRLIESSEKLLDDLLIEYEETLNTRLDNLDFLVEQMIGEINADAGVIGDTIREVTDKVGYTLTDSMKTIWDENSVNTKNVITTYGDKFVNAQTTTNIALNNINTNLQNLIKQLDEKAKTNTKSASTSSVTKSSGTKTTTNKTTTKTTGGDGKPKIGDKVKFVSGQYYYDSQGKKPLGSHNQGEYVYITNINDKDWATHPYHISTGLKLGSGDLGWLKLNQINGYAIGKKNSLNDEIAWTQENGQEFIVRPSDGAILTPIAKGDSVLTSVASNNIWNMANSPAEFIKDNLNLGITSIPNNSNIHNNFTQHLDKVIFNMPNVMNYEQFLSAMQKDKNFERLVKSMTIDQIAGKSSLGKGKAIR